MLLPFFSEQVPPIPHGSFEQGFSLISQFFPFAPKIKREITNVLTRNFHANYTNFLIALMTLMFTWFTETIVSREVIVALHRVGSDAWAHSGVHIAFIDVFVTSLTSYASFTNASKRSNHILTSSCH